VLALRKPVPAWILLLSLIELPGVGFLQFFCFLNHPAVLDPLAHHFGMLRGGHGWDGHQIFELRGVAVVTFHKTAKSSASLRNRLTMLRVLL
jgi:hypothetical protein